MTDPILTRRQFLAGVGVGAVAVGLGACTPGATPQPAAATGTPSPPTPAPTPAPTQDTALRQRIAGLLVVGFRGLTVVADGPLAREIREMGLGGVILFDKDGPTGGPRNIGSPDQLRSLCGDLQAIAAESPIGGPLLIAIDQEGGAVARLGPERGFPVTRSAAALAKLKDPVKTQAASAAMAHVLAISGVNLNLAPVVDLDVNPKSPAIGALGRSFGKDASTVITQAEAFVQGHHEHEVVTALKHFPGHGSATGDTHDGVTDVTKTWTVAELEPYRAIIAGGLADAILVGHVYNATIDPERPASLSKPTITGILRDQLGFAGPVITDDLEMGAIAEAYGIADALVFALDAGADLLLLANQTTGEDGLASRAVDWIAEAVADGRLEASRIDDAWQRVNAFRTGLLPGPA